MRSCSVESSGPHPGTSWDASPSVLGELGINPARFSGKAVMNGSPVWCTVWEILKVQRPKCYALPLVIKKPSFDQLTSHLKGWTGLSHKVRIVWSLLSRSLFQHPIFLLPFQGQSKKRSFCVTKWSEKFWVELVFWQWGPNGWQLLSWGKLGVCWAMAVTMKCPKHLCLCLKHFCYCFSPGSMPHQHWLLQAWLSLLMFLNVTNVLITVLTKELRQRSSQIVRICQQTSASWWIRNQRCFLSKVRSSILLENSLLHLWWVEAAETS